MSDILVTGARGMLGREVVRALSSRHAVVGVDIEEFDIRDAAATLNAIRRTSPDIIVNCAAYTDVDGAEARRELAFAVNADGAGNVARAAGEVGAAIVHISTDYVFDGESKSPYRENDTPNPLNIYGESKLAGEKAVAESGAQYLTLRTAWLYGHGSPNFVETMLRLAGEQESLRVVDDQEGMPTSAADLAMIIVDLLPTGVRGVLNATNSGSCTWFTFARRILELSGGSEVVIEPVRTEEFTRPAKRPRRSVLSLVRLTESLGWEPRSWQEALADYLTERQGG
jgi:dTDP-4-dehydrorhamnose reductase